MAISVTHTFVSPVADAGNPDEVGPNEWNAAHTISGLGTAAEADSTDFATAAQGALADSAVQPGDVDALVSANADVAANTAARHAAVTVTDSAEINFTLTGQDITASLIAGSIDESKLDTSVNASLDLADSAVQPAAIANMLETADIGVSVQAYSANLDEYAAVNPTAAGLALLDDANAAAQLVTLGLTATATELNYTDGVTSAIQTQLDAKIANSLLTTRGDIIRRGASAPERYALGTAGYALKSDGTDIVYAPSREVLTAPTTVYVGANIPTPTISIATPAVVSSTAHGLSVNAAVVFDVPLNTKAATISAANPAVVAMTNTFAAGQPVVFSSTGSLPIPLVEGTTYYVIATGLSGSSFRVSATVGGAAISTAPPTATFTNGSANIGITNANTYLRVGQRVRFATTGGLPTNFAVATDYYVLTASSTQITVAATSGGSAIVAGSAGTGTQTVLQAGSQYVSTAGALPTGITAGTKYYVISAGLTANAFQISATQGGAAVNTSGSVTGSPVYSAYTGSDSNTGSAATPGAALLTIQKAWDNIVARVDTAGYAVTIKPADGIYSAGLRAGPIPPVGGGVVSLVGNTTTPSNVMIAPSSPGSVGVQAIGPVYVEVGGIYLNSSNIQVGLYADISGNITISGNMQFGTCTVHIQTSHGFIFANAPYMVTGPAGYHLYSAYGGQIEYAAVAATVIGTPTFTWFAYAYATGTIAAASSAGVTFPGNAIGTRYVSSVNAVIDTSGGGANFFPGNAAGSAVSQGLYI